MEQTPLQQESLKRTASKVNNIILEEKKNQIPSTLSVLLRKFEHPIPNLDKTKQGKINSTHQLLAILSQGNDLTLFSTYKSECSISGFHLKNVKEFEWLPETFQLAIEDKTKDFSVLVILTTFFNIEFYYIFLNSTVFETKFLRLTLPIVVELSSTNKFVTLNPQFTELGDVFTYQLSPELIEQQCEGNVTSVHLIGVISPDTVVLLLNESICLLLNLSINQIQFSKSFPINFAHPTQVIVRGYWLFEMESSGNVYIWNLQTLRSKTIRPLDYLESKVTGWNTIKNINTGSTLSRPYYFTHLDVSRDLLYLVAADKEGYLICMDLDDHFKSVKKNISQKLSQKEMNVDYSGVNLSLAHWYETFDLSSSVFSEGRDLDWIPKSSDQFPNHGLQLRVEPTFISPPRISKRESFYLPKLSQSSNQCLYNSVALGLFSPVTENSEIEQVIITPLTIIVKYRDHSSNHLWFYDRITGSPIKVEFNKPYCLLFVEDNSWYYIDSDGLHTVLLGFTISQQQLLNNLIMFESSALADSLCALNNWDRRSLKLHALELGLRHRQIDVIEPALKHLDLDQKLRGSELLLDFINSNTVSVQDEEFVDHLIKIGMKFLSDLIQLKADAVQKLLTNNSEKLSQYGTWNFTPVPSNESDGSNCITDLYLFSEMLGTLRKYRSNFKQVKKRQFSASMEQNSSIKLATLVNPKKLGRDSQKKLKPRALFGMNSEELTSIPSFEQESSIPVHKNSNSEGTSFVLPDLDKIPLSFGSYHERWESLQEVEIIRDSLISGNISLALSFLQDRKKTEFLHGIRSGQLLFDAFKTISFCLIYQTICQDQLDLGITMIQNIGEDPISCLKELFFNTTRHNIRSNLFNFLLKENALSKKDNELIGYLNKLEELYQNSSYIHIHKSLAIKQGKIINFVNEDESITSKLFGSDLDDLTIETKVKYGFYTKGSNDASFLLSRGSRNRIELPPLSSSTKLVNGYSQSTLAWIQQWDEENRQKILMEKTSLADLSNFNPLVQLKFFLSHNKWRNAIDWVKKLTFEGSIDQFGKFNPSSSNIQLTEFLQVVSSILKLAAPYLQEILIQEFAKKGIFLEVELETSQTNYFPLLFRRLCKTGLLFYGASSNTNNTASNSNRSSPLNLSSLLPKSNYSPFHKFVIDFCIEHDLSNMLQVYLDFYDLMTTPESLKTFGLNQLKLPWIKLFFDFRFHNRFFVTSITQSQLLFEDFTILSVNDLLAHGKDLIGLGSLMFSEVGLTNSLTVDKNQPEYVDDKIFKDLLESYPTLHSAVFQLENQENLSVPIVTARSDQDILSHNGDISLVQLLEESPSPFHLEELFTQLIEYDFEKGNIAEIERKSVFLSAFVDYFDLHYFLSNGKCMEAFHLILYQKELTFKNCHFIRYEDFSIDVLSLYEGGPSWMQINSEIVSTTSIELRQHELNFLIWYVRCCGIIHLLEQKVISACIGFLDLCGIDSQLVRVDIEAAKRIYFFQVSNKKSKTKIEKERNQTLKEIVNLFLSLKPNSNSIQTALSELEEATRSYVSTSSVSKWLLVTLFCSVHNLELSSGHLCELAEKNDWITFLYEAETQKFPTKQILQIVDYFSDPAIRYHLTVVVQILNEQYSENDSLQYIDPSQNIFTVLLSAQKSKDPAKTLVFLSVESNRPFLSVIATAFPSNSITLVDCIAAFLCAAFPSELTSFRARFSYSVEWKTFLLSELSQLIIAVCENKHLVLLLRCFYIFDPQNIIIKYLSFHQAFLLKNWEFCSKHIEEFVNSLQEKPKFSIGTEEWGKNLAIQLMHLLLTQFNSPYEVSHLISFMEKSKLSPQFKSLVSTFYIMEKTAQKLDLRSSPSEIISLLVSQGLFNEARYYSKENDIPSDYITIQQVNNMELELKNTQWQNEEDRKILWNRCHSLFIKTGINGKIGGEYFYDKAYHSTPITTQEKILLFSLALYWFKLTNSNIIEEINDSILFLSIELELSSLESSDRGKVLSNKIGKLIHSGNIDQAEKICSQFSYKSQDLEMIKLSLDIANRILSPENLPPPVKEKLRKVTNHPLDFAIASRKEILQLLIQSCSSFSREYAERIGVNFQVAEALGLSFSVVIERDPFEILDLLLLYGRELFSLTTLFIDYNKLDLVKVTSIVSTFYFNQVITEISSLEPNKNFISQFTDADFSEFVSLTKRPREVGIHLLNKITSFIHENSKEGLKDKELQLLHAAEVEIIIKAHSCFLQSCSMGGVELVMNMIHTRVKEYVSAGEFNLLVRLLTGLKSYIELEYIFGMLIENQRFELLLQKKYIQTLDDAGVINLRVAIHSYLVTNHPKDLDKLQMLFLRFHMYREIAENLLLEANRKLEAIRNKTINAESRNYLLDIMQNFLDAADNFSKEKCYVSANSCLAMGSLIALQIQSPDSKVINLQDDEVAQLMSFRGKFHDVFILATAYKRNLLSNWIGPLYQQVVVSSNFKFLEDYLYAIPAVPELFIELKEKFKHDPQRSNRSVAFKTMLNYLEDEILKLEIAEELGFEDIAGPLRASGISSLKQIFTFTE